MLFSRWSITTYSMAVAKSGSTRRTPSRALTRFLILSVSYFISFYFITSLNLFYGNELLSLPQSIEYHKSLTTPQLIEYHKLNCAGMVCRLRQPLPREDSPPVVGNQFGQFNINPAEVRQSLGTQIILKDIHSYSCSVSSLVWIRCSNTSSELCLIVTNIVCH